MNGYERSIAALEGRRTDRCPLMPITMMFAADRIGAPYGQYVTDYHVLVEGQIRTAEAFGFDHVSCISCPTREAADCGADIQYFEDQPPAVREGNALLKEKTRLATLSVPDPYGGGRMHDRIQAVELFRQEVGGEKLIEGWIEGPCAEGADLRGINTLMMDFYDDPAFVRDLFAFNLEMGITFAKAQVQAGVDIIGVGDAAASLVGPAIYREFVWPAEKNLFDALHAMGTRVRLHICGNITPILDQIGTLGVDFVDLDFMVPVHAAREKIGDDQVLAGNIDPVRTLRDGTPDSIIRALEECRHQAGPHYIIAAGCEVPRDTPIENVKAVYEYAQTTGSGA